MARILLDNNEWAIEDDLSFFNISSELIDLTDGTWTLFDPDNLVQGISFASGFNTVTWNAGAGSNDYKWTQGTAHRSPRWYKLLKIDGQQITSDDCMTFQASGKLDDSVKDFDHEIVWGICSDPTSTSALTIDGSGAVMARQLSAGGPRYGIWTENLVSFCAANSNNISGAASLIRGKLMMVGGASVSINASGNAFLPANRTDTQALAATTNQFLMVGVGTNTTTTVDSGDKQKFSLKMTVFTHDISF